MKRYEWKLKNITCAACVRTVERYLATQDIADSRVNVMTGLISFTAEDEKISQMQSDLARMGYPRVQEEPSEQPQTRIDWILLICICLTLPLLAHMFLTWKILNNSWLQLVLATPVYFLGCWKFGAMAYRSLVRLHPNMDVLIILGASSAYVYSIIGIFILKEHRYMFFETAAAIFTIVMLGSSLEHLAMRRMRRALGGILQKKQSKAHMIVFDDKRQELVMEIASSELRVGDLLLIKSGDQVPTDAKILWGEVMVDESIITGESLPVTKEAGDIILGGSMLVDGTCKVQVRTELAQSAMGKILECIAKVEASKPPIQAVADRISAIFVPTVLLCALVTFAANWYFAGNFEQAMMRAIAVMVVSCPCALGLATPSAIFVGLSMAYKRGILFKNASNMEIFKNIRQIAFDKTGTLTTGELKVLAMHSDLDLAIFQEIILGLEQFSNHPIARSLKTIWTSQGLTMIKVTEHKGLGISGEDLAGNKYYLGSYKVLEKFSIKPLHIIPKTLYLIKNASCVGWLELGDQVRPEAGKILDYLRRKGIAVSMISGDLKHKCQQVAEELGITQIYAECSPQDKLNIVAKLNAQKPLAMVGDGINDAPALAQATVGISLGGAADIAIQSAEVVLLNGTLSHLPFALGIGRATLRTIYENFTWGLSYNIFAIPYVALGGLNPVVAALIMGLSDIVLLINSARLTQKKIH